MRRLKTIPLIGVAFAAALTLCGCGTAVNTAPSQKALVYAGGGWAGDARIFKTCVGESSGRVRFDQGDRAYYYPAGQRTYEFSAEADADSGPIQITTKDGVQMDVSGVATFSLNTTCKDSDTKPPLTVEKNGALPVFHQRIGLKYAAYQDNTNSEFEDDDQGGGDDVERDKGWNRTLGIYLGNPLQVGMKRTALDYTMDDLTKTPAKNRQWQAAVVELVPQLILAQATGPFFCGPGFTGRDGEPCGTVTIDPKTKESKCEGCIGLQIGTPQPPQSVVDQRNAAQANALRQAAVNAEKASIAALVKLLGPNGYIYYRWQQQVEKAQAEGKPLPPQPILPGTGVLYPAVPSR